MAETIYPYKTVTPYLLVADADAELEFLKAAFGALETECQRDGNHRVMHAELMLGDCLVMMGQASDTFKARNAGFYLWVKDVDEAYAKALAAGAKSDSAPEDKPYGHRNAGVVDPAGMIWWLAAPVK